MLVRIKWLCVERRAVVDHSHPILMYPVTGIEHNDACKNTFIHDFLITTLGTGNQFKEICSFVFLYLLLLTLSISFAGTNSCLFYWYLGNIQCTGGPSIRIEKSVQILLQSGYTFQTTRQSSIFSRNHDEDSK